MITRMEALKALVISSVISIAVRLTTDLIFGRDVQITLTDAQQKAIDNMPYRAALNLIDAHSVPAPLWNRIEVAFYWDFFWPPFILVAGIAFIASLALLIWSKRQGLWRL